MVDSVPSTEMLKTQVLKPKADYFKKNNNSIATCDLMIEEHKREKIFPKMNQIIW